MFVDKSKKKKGNGGFVALISTVLLSAMLLLIVLTLSTSSFFARYGILSTEFKERSFGSAEACADIGLLMIANKEFLTSSTTLTVTGIGNCTISPIPPTGNPRIFYSKSNINGFITNLKISVDPSTLSVISWEEIGTY